MRRTAISLHDLTPATRGRIERLLGTFERLRLAPVTLLVIPGSGWDRAGTAWLRGLQERGHDLAAHGWSHRVTRLRGWRHRLHGALLSAQAAEHLALEPGAARALLVRSYGWFIDQGLAAPQVYVPPAWALGRLAHDALETGPFRCYETLRGLYDVRRRRWLFPALLGFEARLPWQALALRAWNAVMARSPGVLRVAIHPDDPELLLRRSLERWLHAPLRNATYAALLRDGGAP